MFILLEINEQSEFQNVFLKNVLTHFFFNFWLKLMKFIEDSVMLRKTIRTTYSPLNSTPVKLCWSFLYPRQVLSLLHPPPTQFLLPCALPPLQKVRLTAGYAAELSFWSYDPALTLSSCPMLYNMFTTPTATMGSSTASTRPWLVPKSLWCCSIYFPHLYWLLLLLDFPESSLIF